MSTLEFNDALIRLEQYLKAFAMTYTKNEDDAQDLTQETILKALSYRDYYTPQTNFKAWVFTIMRNIFINQYRRNVKGRTMFEKQADFQVHQVAASSHYTPDNHILGLELNNHLESIPNEYKTPFEMHHQGYKYQEIADAMEIPVGTVKSRIFIARKKLMNQINSSALA